MKNQLFMNVRAASLLLVLTASLPVMAGPASIVVCYPGGPVSEAEANTAMGAMLRVVERLGGWPANSLNSVFTAQVNECRKLLDTRQPAFAITSLGLFLEQQDRHHLTPIVQPQIKGATTERYRLVAQQGKFSSVESLKGKTIGGTVFEEPEFIRKMVFANQFDPSAFFSLKPSRQAIRALRSLDKGELDAVLLSGQQYAALDSLPLKSALAAVFTSTEIPLMGMVANSQASTAEERTRMARAMQATCADGEGRKLCDLFGIEAFMPASPASINAAVTLWKQGK